MKYNPTAPIDVLHSNVTFATGTATIAKTANSIMSDEWQHILINALCPFFAAALAGPSSSSTAYSYLLLRSIID